MILKVMGVAVGEAVEGLLSAARGEAAADAACGVGEAVYAAAS